MDDIKFGRAMRAIRIGSRQRQIDVARRAGISRSAVSDTHFRTTGTGRSAAHRVRSAP